MTDDDSISEDRMRAALQTHGSSPHTATAPQGRHRYVQDGEVPVVLLNPRHRHFDANRPAIAELERSLLVEREARRVAEKALLEAEETIRQLETRLAHAELAQQERVLAPLPPLEEPVQKLEKPARKTRVKRVKATERIAQDEPVDWWRPGWRERI